MKGLTGLQAVLYASRIKNPSLSNSKDHKEIALRWLQELDILCTAETPVERCSGGERKRLAVALELVNHHRDLPQLLIADEITSGLDSHSAEVVMASLKRVTSAHPLAILVSIHQPTSATLYHFDQIGVLGRGGVALYGGPPQAMHLFLESCVPELFQNSSSFTTPPIELLIRQSCCATPTDALTLKLVKLAESVSFSKSFEIELLEETYLLTSADELKRAFQSNRFTLHSVRQLLCRQLLYLRNYLWKEWLTYVAFGTLFAACLRLLVPESVALPSSCVNPAEDDLTARLSGSGCEDVVVAAAKSSPEKLNAELLFLDNYYYLYYAVIIYMLLPLFYSTVSWHLDAGLLESEHRNGLLC